MTSTAASSEPPPLHAASEDAPSPDKASPEGRAPHASAERTGRKEGLRDVLRAFATTDPRTLGLFRVAFGVWLLVDLYRRIPDFSFFYSNEGMLPNHASLYRPMSGWIFSLFHAASTPQEAAVMFALTGVVYFFYLIGYKTKWMQVLVLLLLTSMHSRNVMLENGGDVVGNLQALWTVFLPLGARFSVDAMLASLRARKETSPADLNDRRSPLPETRPIVSLAFAAAVLNLFAIYYFNTVHKDGWIWRQGLTVHYVLNADRLVQPLGVLARNLTPLVVIRVLTTGTLVIESSLFLLLLSPVWIRACRRVASFLILALHCGLQTVGHFGMFSFVMMLFAVLLLGPEDWEALARRMRAILPRRVVFFDASCGICLLAARVLKRLDHLQRIELVANTNSARLPPGVTEELTEQSILVARADNSVYWTGGEALTQILRALPYGWGLARTLRLPGLRALLDNLYERVAENRRDISVFFGLDACGIEHADVLHDPPAVEPRPVLLASLRRFTYHAVIAVVMFACFIQILAENRHVPAILKPPAMTPPSPQGLYQRWMWALGTARDWVTPIAQYPRFFQGWAMFAPIPPVDDGIIVVDATTIDGRHIDPLTNGRPVTFELAGQRECGLVSQFWYEFHDRERRPENAGYYGYLQDYFINWHTWANRPANDQIVAFEAFWVSRPTQEPGSPIRMPVQKTSILKWKSPSAPIANPIFPRK